MLLLCRSLAGGGNRDGAVVSETGEICLVPRLRASGANPQGSWSLGDGGAHAGGAMRTNTLERISREEEEEKNKRNG